MIIEGKAGNKFQREKERSQTVENLVVKVRSLNSTIEKV